MAACAIEVNMSVHPMEAKMPLCLMDFIQEETWLFISQIRRDLLLDLIKIGSTFGG